MEICFASHNPNKVREINAILPQNIHCKGLSDLGICDEIEESGNTLEANSLIKARFVFDRLKIPVFADDSGLFTEALDGAPGVYSARYAGFEKSDSANIRKLLSELDSFENKKAAFRTVIAWIDARGHESFFYGEVKGQLISEIRGTNGFGYDPIFVPEGYELTFAEIPASEKNKISHRSKALNHFAKYLSSAYGL